MSEEFPIQPLWSNVFIKYEKTEKVGTVIKITSEEHTARVMAVGPGRTVGDTNIPCKVKEGDIVLVSASAPGMQVLLYQGNQYFCIPETSIVGVIKPQAELPEIANEA